MKPLNGVVVSIQEHTISIKIETGMELTTRNRFNLKVGDKVSVYYDYAKMKVAKVIPATGVKLFKVEPNKDKIMDICLDVSGLALFGALLPCCDWSVAWDLDSGPDALDPVIDGDLEILLSEEGIYVGATKDPSNK